MLRKAVAALVLSAVVTVAYASTVTVSGKTVTVAFQNGVSVSRNYSGQCTNGSIGTEQFSQSEDDVTVEYVNVQCLVLTQKRPPRLTKRLISTIYDDGSVVDVPAASLR